MARRGSRSMTPRGSQPRALKPRRWRSSARWRRRPRASPRSRGPSCSAALAVWPAADLSRALDVPALVAHWRWPPPLDPKTFAGFAIALGLGVAALAGWRLLERTAPEAHPCGLLRRRGGADAARRHPHRRRAARRRRALGRLGRQRGRARGAVRRRGVEIPPGARSRGLGSDAARPRRTVGRRDRRVRRGAGVCARRRGAHRFARARGGGDRLCRGPPRNPGAALVRRGLRRRRRGEARLGAAHRRRRPFAAADLQLAALRLRRARRRLRLRRPADAHPRGGHAGARRRRGGGAVLGVSGVLRDPPCDERRRSVCRAGRRSSSRG